MDILKDIYKFLSFLTIVDIIFFVSIIVLLILIVTLIYFIKINKEVKEDNTMIPPNDSNGENYNKEDKINVFMDSNELFEDPNEIVVEHDDEEGELWDLESLTKKLQAEKQEPINFSAYEQDQEEKAIISYDELLQKHNKYAINYEKEEIMDDLIVKKVNLNNLINTKDTDDNLKVRVISYRHEEAFLSALKELNRLLN